MKKAKLLFFGFFLISLLNAQVMWQFKTDTVIKWYYYDGDEFNGPTYDDKKWTPAYSWSNVNYDLKYLMTPKRMVFDSGLCHFMCYRDTGLYEVPNWTLDSNFIKRYKSDIIDGNKFRYYFTAGNVWSKMQYTHGYFEIRFKTTDAYGMWPAFWMFGSGKDEIDYFELKGERSKDIHVDMHCIKGCDHGYRGGSIFPKSFGGWVKSTRSLAETYNVFSGEWQDGYVKWYLNGEGIAIFNGDLESKKMSLMIGTGPAEDGKGFAPGVNASTKFPNSFDVDYVRVWYKENTPKTEVLGKVNTDFDYHVANEQTKSYLKKKINYMYSKKAFAGDVVTISVLPKKGKKLLLIANGKLINYKASFYDESGKQLFQKTINESFVEEGFNGTAGHKVHIKIEAAGRVAEETIILQ